MFGPDSSTAVGTRPAPAAAGTPGWFSNGNPASGTPATIVEQDFLNGILAELLSVLSAAGIAPSKSATNQLLLSIQALATAASSSLANARNNLGVNIAGGTTVTLSAAQAAYGVITLVGVLTANVAVIFPATGKWTINNQTTGAFTATCGTPGGTGYNVRQGFAYDLYADGTNMLPDGPQTFWGTAGPPTLQPLEVYYQYS